MAERGEKFEGLDAVKSEILAARDQIAEPDSAYTVRVRGEREKDDVDVVRRQIFGWLEEVSDSGSLKVRAKIEFKQGRIQTGDLPLPEKYLSFEPRGCSGLKKGDILSAGEVYMMGIRLVETFKRAKSGEKDIEFATRQSDLDKWVTPNNYDFPESLRNIWPDALEEAIHFRDLLDKLMDRTDHEVNFRHSSHAVILNPTMLD